ncbi:hypothetical protein EAE96_007114 [Botrytis aclada]|nr:hypothetical protein EAE96_007114 [Botrytis aclada]
MSHHLTYHTHGATRILTPPTSNSSNPSPSSNLPAKPPQAYAVYAARFTHTYPSQDTVDLGTLPPTSPIPVTPIRASLSGILLAQRSAIARIEMFQTHNRDLEGAYLPVHLDEAFRTELNDGVGFYLDIYFSSEEVFSFLQKWPFDDTTKKMVRDKRLPNIDLVLEFDQLNEKLHKLGRGSSGYHLNYSCIPRSENRAVEADVMEDLDRYTAKLEEISKKKVSNDGTEEEVEEVEELTVLKSTPVSKSGEKPGGKSILTPKSTPAQKPKSKLKKVDNDRMEEEVEEVEELTVLKSMPVSKSKGKSEGKLILTPKSTPVQKPKPKPKLKLISRDPRLQKNLAPKAPES